MHNIYIYSWPETRYMRIESIQKHWANVPDIWKWKSWGMSLYIHYFPQHPGMVYFPTFTIIYHTNQPNVGKYSRYVDGMDLSLHDVTLLSKKDLDFKTASWWNRQNKTHSKRSISSPSPSPAGPGRILWTAGIFPKEFSILPVRTFLKKNSTFLRVRHPPSGWRWPVMPTFGLAFLLSRLGDGARGASALARKANLVLPGQKLKANVATKALQNERTPPGSLIFLENFENYLPGN